MVDPHTLLWFAAGDRRRIGKALQARIEAEATEVSAASLWEIAIKSSLGNHRNPFDRLLIAQAQMEGVPIVTADPAFGDNDVTVVWG